jgi:hypothetical protein
MSRFRMTDLGIVRKYLSLQFYKTLDGFLLHQSDYAYSVVEEFRMANCNPCQTPMQANLKLQKETNTSLVNPNPYRRIVEKFIFLTNTRLDIAFVVNLVSWYMHQPQEAHFKAVKTIIRYIKGTTSLGLHYKKDSSLELTGYNDTDWEGIMMSDA